VDIDEDGMKRPDLDELWRLYMRKSWMLNWLIDNGHIDDEVYREMQLAREAVEGGYGERD